MLDDILTRTPVNKLAALVTNQSGCEDDQSLSDQRECIIKAIKRKMRSINQLPKKHLIRINKGHEIADLQGKLTIINREIKIHAGNESEIDRYIISECKTRFSDREWKEIIKTARDKRKNKNYDYE